MQDSRKDHDDQHTLRKQQMNNLRIYIQHAEVQDLDGLHPSIPSNNQTKNLYNCDAAAWALLNLLFGKACEWTYTFSVRSDRIVAALLPSIYLAMSVRRSLPGRAGQASAFPVSALEKIRREYADR